MFTKSIPKLKNSPLPKRSELYANHAGIVYSKAGIMAALVYYDMIMFFKENQQ